VVLNHTINDLLTFFFQQGSTSLLLIVSAALLNFTFSSSSIIQVALRAVVLQPGVMWFGSRYLLVVSTIVPQALVQSGAGVESYSDASSGMATIMRNEVK
jgi:hypothetical protein